MDFRMIKSKISLLILQKLHNFCNKLHNSHFRFLISATFRHPLLPRSARNDNYAASLAITYERFFPILRTKCSIIIIKKVCLQPHIIYTPLRLVIFKYPRCTFQAEYYC